MKRKVESSKSANATTFESKLEANSTTGDDLKTFPMAEVEKKLGSAPERIS